MLLPAKKVIKSNFKRLDWNDSISWGKHFYTEILVRSDFWRNRKI